MLSVKISRNRVDGGAGGFVLVVHLHNADPEIRGS